MSKHDSEMEKDAELWARVARTAAPLSKKTRAAPTAPTKMPPRPRQRPGAPSPKPPKAVAKAGHVPSTAGLDRQTARKLDTGRLAVEARLDLHGMRQRDAHAALRKFLKWAQAKDFRHVLVITGKGAARDERKGFYEAERGVLRQSVPRWLGQADLAPLIVSYAPAPRRLGGEGALYVRLRRAQPSK